MSKNEDLLDIIASLEALNKTKLYDVDKLLCSIKHMVGQLEYFYCTLVPNQGGDPDNTFYYLSNHPTIHQLAYFNIGRGFPKELMDGHWCYILKDLGYKMVVIPCTSIKEDSKECNPSFEMDITIKKGRELTKSRLQLSDIRSIDSQRLDSRKRPCQVLTPRSDILNFVYEQLLDDTKTLITIE